MTSKLSQLHYVKIDDLLRERPDLAPARPAGGIPPTVSDAEVLTMAVMSAFLGFTSERRWLRHVSRHLAGMFPRRIGRSGYDKRLRKLCFLLMASIRVLGTDTSLWTDDVWVVDSTPVPCGCSRETATRSEVAGWAGYGYCASHSRYFWGLRLHLVRTLHGLPVMFALAGAKADEREALLGMLEHDAGLVMSRPGQTVIGDKNYFGRDFEALLADGDLRLLRQVVESVNWSLKGQLDLEEHGGRTEGGIFARVLVRVLALTAGVWHNDKTGQEVKRSLIAYDY